MLIDFKGYAGDCIVSGRLELTAPRLTDMLNEHAVIHLRDATLESLVDGVSVRVPTFSMHRDDLCAARVSGPRGAAWLRVATVIHRVQAQIGPYNVLGCLHTHPPDTVLTSLAARGPMLPLTDATIAYVVGGILEVRDLSVVLVNRDLASWVRDTESDGIVVAGTPAPRDGTGVPVRLLSTAS